MPTPGASGTVDGGAMPVDCAAFRFIGVKLGSVPGIDVAEYIPGIDPDIIGGNPAPGLKPEGRLSPSGAV